MCDSCDWFEMWTAEVHRAHRWFWVDDFLDLGFWVQKTATLGVKNSHTSTRPRDLNANSHTSFDCRSLSRAPACCSHAMRHVAFEGFMGKVVGSHRCGGHDADCTNRGWAKVLSSAQRWVVQQANQLRDQPRAHSPPRTLIYLLNSFQMKMSSCLT